MGKYEPLRSFLERQAAQEVPMTFAEIERVIGTSLPEKSKMLRPWWSNNPNNNVMTKAWLAAGYRTERVDMGGERLVFRRVGQDMPAASAGSAPRGGTGSKGDARRRHPILGCMKGTLTILPGVDLTEPADPDWGKVYDD